MSNSIVRALASLLSPVRGGGNTLLALLLYLGLYQGGEQ